MFNQCWQIRNDREAELDWCCDTMPVTSYSAPRLAVYSGVIDDTNSESYKVFVLQRSMKCLYSPRNQRAIHHENWRGGCLATVWEARGFWRLWCVCIWKSATLPSKNEGKRIVFVPFIWNLVWLFDMEMVEVTVRLILKALSLALDKPWESTESERDGKLGLKRENRK